MAASSALADAAESMAGLIVGGRLAPVFPPGTAEIADLVARMRPADAAEVRAASGVEDLRAIVVDAVAASAEAWAVAFDGELVAVWGVVPLRESLLGGRTGWVWMMTTDTVDRLPKAFWEACKRILPAVLGRWEVLEAAVGADYAAAVRWAKRLGFEVGPAEPAGGGGALFHPCRIRRP